MRSSHISDEFGFQNLASDGQARTGVLRTAHGEIHTPAFMVVGTAGTVKAMTPEAVLRTGAECILGNTYHLMLRPGADRVARFGGLRAFMDWSGPILTDSGGFQAMSLAGLAKIDPDGITFQSHIDGSRHRLTPEICMDIQAKLDSTITMVLDECTVFPASRTVAEASMDRSMQWADRSKSAYRTKAGYGLFGIVQGSVFADLRSSSAERLASIGFDGYAVGGLAVGEGQDAMFATLDATVPCLPEAAPRYLMGVGTPGDILGAVMRGIDMFDCVIPTRAGRTARAYTSTGVHNLRNARFADDPGPLDQQCDCPACQRHCRGYLHHLFRCGEMLGPMMLTWHNISYYQKLMRDIRTAISQSNLSTYARQVQDQWGGDGHAHS